MKEKRRNKKKTQRKANIPRQNFLVSQHVKILYFLFENSQIYIYELWARENKEKYICHSIRDPVYSLTKKLK